MAGEFICRHRWPLGPSGGHGDSDAQTIVGPNSVLGFAWRSDVYSALFIEVGGALAYNRDAVRVRSQIQIHPCGQSPKTGQWLSIFRFTIGYRLTTFGIYPWGPPFDDFQISSRCIRKRWGPVVVTTDTPVASIHTRAGMSIAGRRAELSAWDLSCRCCSTRQRRFSAKARGESETSHRRIQKLCPLVCTGVKPDDLHLLREVIG